MVSSRGFTQTFQLLTVWCMAYLAHLYTIVPLIDMKMQAIF